MRRVILGATLLAAMLAVLTSYRPSRADQSPTVCWLCVDWGWGYEECSLDYGYFDDCIHRYGKCWVSGPGCLIEAD